LKALITLRAGKLLWKNGNPFSAACDDNLHLLTKVFLMKSYFLVSNEHNANLELRDAPKPRPGSAQVLLKMSAAALNRGEFIHGHGLHGSGAKAAGMEGAGEIIELGSEVKNLQIGAQVMGRCAAAFSEYAVMDVREVMPKPAGLTMQQAAAIPLTFLVTFDLLVLQGHLKAGQWLLVNGVSSGVGVASMQMGKILGAKVIGTSGSQQKLEDLKKLGLDEGITTRAPNYFDEVMRITAGKGVNLAVNTVGGSVFAETLKCLSFEGRMGFVGYVDGQLTAPVDLNTLHAKRLCIYGVSNKLRSLEQRASGNAEFSRQILPAFNDGRIKPLIHQTFAFEALPQAKALMESNEQNGKIILNINA
jgi:NADPH:quinone reductase